MEDIQNGERRGSYKPRAQIVGRQPLGLMAPLSTPIVVIIDPSSACDFKCAFCPTGDLKLIRDIGRRQVFLDFGVYKKCIDDLGGFDKSIHMLKLYKDGEPLLNPNLVGMVEYARSKTYVGCIMVTTNGSRLSPELSRKLVEAGLSRIHISLEGMSKEKYKSFAKVNFDFDQLVERIAYLYSIRGKCEVSVKIPYENLAEGEEEKFHALFKGICDSYFIEHISPVWPNFDVSKLGPLDRGLYDMGVKSLEVCPHIFYQMAVNSDGTVSACCVDWKRALVVGDAKISSLVDIWRGTSYDKLRITHLEKRRCELDFCRNCGQLTHAAKDDIDVYAEEILHRMRGEGE